MNVIATTDRGGFKTEIDELIESSQIQLLGVINFQLVTLFWYIGIEINRQCNKNESEKNALIVRDISNHLKRQFGDYFTLKNIINIQAFAKQFPTFLTDTIHSITWNHILPLLEIADRKELLFYFHLIQEEDLTVVQLREEIAANSYTMKERRHNTRATTVSAKRSKSSNQQTLTNLFREPELRKFKKLMSLPKINIQVAVEHGLDRNVLNTLTHYILTFQDSITRRTNAKLNTLFWHIGKLVNSKLIQQGKNDGPIEAIKNVVDGLSTKRRQIELKDFTAMSLFAEHVTDINLAIRLGKLVSWAHMVELLVLKEIEAKLFYARISASRGLSASQLRTFISEKMFEKDPDAMENGLQTISIIQEPKVKKEITTSKNSVVEITTHYINYGEDIQTSKAVPHIFKNPYLHILIGSS